MQNAVIVSAVRTPIGNFWGSLASCSARELGVAAVQEAIRRARVEVSDVQEVIFAKARQAGSGPNLARQIAVKSGIPKEVPAFTVNMACASSLKAIELGAQAIWLGRADVVVVGGTESMSQLPYLLRRAQLNEPQRSRFGHLKLKEAIALAHEDADLLDGMFQDGFMCPLAEQLMGRTAENIAQQYSISREDQDAFAYGSHQRAVKAQAEGRFREELISVEVKGNGSSHVVERDEHPRADTTMEKLATLKAVFLKDGGTVTAGNASGVTDGAAALVLMSADRARALGITPLVQIEGAVAAGVDPRLMGLGPIPATRTLLQQVGRSIDQYDVIESNEAFAAQYLAVERDLKLPRDRTNVNGGAIALGHPIGCTGARIVTTLIHEMLKRKSPLGLVNLCVSGGMGMAMSFRNSSV